MERSSREALKLSLRAQQAYEAASNEQKPEALLHMLEAEAAARKPMTAYRQVLNEFQAAQDAYRRLLSKP